MGQIIVEVMPKPEILDPQGKAVGSALPRLGITAFTEVRQGKCFHLSVEGPVTEQALAEARHAAQTVLSNPIIEDVVRVEELPEPGESRSQGHQGCGCGHRHGGRNASQTDEAQPIEVTTSHKSAASEGKTGCGCGRHAKQAADVHQEGLGE